MMSATVVRWWVFLGATGALNISAWALSAVALGRRRALDSAEVFNDRRLHLLLCAGYVFGCAFRSAVPVYDVPRICLFDSWVSSVIVGRSVASIAELCFAGQWALMLREMSSATQSRFGTLASMAVVPLIAIAECFSWYSVLTTSNIGHVAEESIWGFAAALMVVSMMVIWPRCHTSSLRRLLVAGCVVGTAYVAFMFLVDVPMYWARWLTDEAGGRHYLSIAQGVLDVSTRRVVSYRWEDWRREVPWMSLYFSVAVWFSLSLIHAPRAAARLPAERTPSLPAASATARGLAS